MIARTEATLAAQAARRALMSKVKTTTGSSGKTLKTAQVDPATCRGNDAAKLLMQQAQRLVQRAQGSIAPDGTKKAGPSDVSFWFLGGYVRPLKNCSVETVLFCSYNSCFCTML